MMFLQEFNEYEHFYQRIIYDFAQTLMVLINYILRTYKKLFDIEINKIFLFFAINYSQSRWSVISCVPFSRCNHTCPMERYSHDYTFCSGLFRQFFEYRTKCFLHDIVCCDKQSANGLCPSFSTYLTWCCPQ